MGTNRTEYEAKASSNEATNPNANTDNFQVLNGNDFGNTLFILLAIIAVTGLIALITIPWPILTAILALLGGFVVTRHFTLIRQKRQLASRSPSWLNRTSSSSSKNPSVPNTDALPAVYFMYVLGSGGHTAEMMETIKQQFRAQPNQHRRYIVTTGDEGSLAKAKQLESLISSAYPSSSSPSSSSKAAAGTSDAFRIRRAREVHQPLYTAPLTCLVAAWHAVAALVYTTPTSRSRRRLERQENPSSSFSSSFGSSSVKMTIPKPNNNNDFRYPHVIITNGPASGFILCAVAHILKVLYLAPQDRMRIVYIETWARSRTLSLTGKLFLMTGIADMFCVQHETLAKVFGPKGARFVGRVSGPPPVPPVMMRGGKGVR